MVRDLFYFFNPIKRTKLVPAADTNILYNDEKADSVQYPKTKEQLPIPGEPELWKSKNQKQADDQ